MYATACSILCIVVFSSFDKQPVNLFLATSWAGGARKDSVVALISGSRRLDWHQGRLCQQFATDCFEMPDLETKDYDTSGRNVDCPSFPSWWAASNLIFNYQ